MEILMSSVQTSLMFLKDNIVKILAVIGFLVASFTMFYLTLISLKKLKVEAFSYYPFDKFFPQSGKWSVGYFLLTILLLGILIYVLIKGQLYLTPA